MPILSNNNTFISHWCLFQVPRGWTPKGHFLKKFDQGIRVGIFQTWLPMTLKTDNGVNLVSVKPENYLRSKEIHRAKSATFWPRSNGEVECYNRTSLKSILAIHAKRKDWRSYFHSVLLDYHSTKHVTTQIAQSMILFGLQTYHIKIKKKTSKNDTTPIGHITRLAKTSSTRPVLARWKNQGKFRIKKFGDKWDKGKCWHT